MSLDIISYQKPRKLPKLQESYLKDQKPWKSGSCSVVSDSLQPHGLYSPQKSPDQNTGVGSLFLFQGIFPIQGSNLGLPHCRQTLYHLSHIGHYKILKIVPYTIQLVLVSYLFYLEQFVSVNCILLIYPLSFPFSNRMSCFLFLVFFKL